MESYSVLMSIYKKENPVYFQTALESMIHQTKTPNEIILVEDGPLTKELYAVIESYKDYLTIVTNKENLGLGLALKKGVEACSYELIARMDADDISEEDRCERQLAFLSVHPEVSIIGGQIEEFIENQQNIVGKRIVPETDKEIKEYMKSRCPFNHMTVMFKKSAVLEAGNYKEWFWNEDYYLWIRMLLHGCKFANLPEVLVHVRVGKDMYSRRGGDKYYKSERGIQKLMLNEGIIDKPLYWINCLKRFVVQKLLPNSIRGWVFRIFARS